MCYEGENAFPGAETLRFLPPQGSSIDGLLSDLKSRKKCANFCPQGSVIDGLLAGLKSRRKCANSGLEGSSIDVQ